MVTSSGSLTLEVTVLSAEDLRVDHHSIKRNAFVIVKADPFNQRATKVDALGGSYPSWDEKIVINLPTNANFLTLEVLRRSSTSGDRLIGTYRVPVSDFVGGYTPDNYLHCLSYRLKDGYGNKNGIVNVSVRVLNVPDGYACSSSQQKLKMPAGPGGYKSPLLQHKLGAVGCSGKDFGGVVTGIPVGYPCMGKF